MSILDLANFPDQVLDRAMKEAMASFDGKTAAFYRLDLDRMVGALTQTGGRVAHISSPLQNIALYRDALDGSSVLAQAGVSTDTEMLMAAFLGCAAGPEFRLNAGTVAAVTLRLGRQLSPERAAAIAENAERIRVALSANNG